MWVLASWNPLLKSSYRFNGFWFNTLTSLKTCFPFVSFAHKFNAFSTLTKHLPFTVGLNFCTFRCDSKNSMNFFSLHNFMDSRFVLTIDFGNLSIWFSSFLLGSELEAFLLKEAKASFKTDSLWHILIASITTVARWDHYILSELRVIWIQALQTAVLRWLLSDSYNGASVCSLDTLDKERIARPGQDSRRFQHTTQKGELR